MQQSTVFQPHNHGPNEGTHRQAKATTRLRRSTETRPRYSKSWFKPPRITVLTHQAKPPSELPARYHMLNHTRSRRMRSVRDQSSFTRFDADQGENTVPATPTVPHEMINLNQLVLADRTKPSQDRKTTTFSSNIGHASGKP